MNMSTKLAVVGAYVLIVSVIVFKQGFENGDYLMVVVGLMSLVVQVDHLPGPAPDPAACGA